MNIFLKNVLIVVAILSFFVIEKTNAATSEVTGWSWSENTGWVSFNSKNCDANGDGISDGSVEDCPSSGTMVGDYGVSVDLISGLFSGYAWSEHLGWINFAPSGPYPTSPNYSACLSFPGQSCLDLPSNKVGGWARVCSAFASGCSGTLSLNRGSWDGWIKFRGNNYGISYNPSSGELSGYAWSDMVAGWINFKGNMYVVSVQGKPTAVDLDKIWNSCLDSLHPTLIWTIQAGPQASYWIQIDTNSGFTNPIYSSSEIFSSVERFLTSGINLEYNKKYYWRVKVKNDQGIESNWASDYFTTPKNAYPTPNFSSSPTAPVINQEITFTNTTIFRDTGLNSCSTDPQNNRCSYFWTFDVKPVSGGAYTLVSSTSYLPNNPKKKVTEKAVLTVNLSATDSNGYTCTTLPGKDISIGGAKLPQWKEITPK